MILVHFVVYSAYMLTEKEITISDNRILVNPLSDKIVMIKKPGEQIPACFNESLSMFSVGSANNNHGVLSTNISRFGASSSNVVGVPTTQDAPPSYLNATGKT